MNRRMRLVRPMEFRSSAVVSRLTMSGGSGYLTIQPLMYSSSYVGLEVAIPAGDGVWTGPDDVPVPDMGIHCLRQPGPDLVYQCGVGSGGDPYDNPTLPPGGYQVTIPVQHTGTSAGLTGQAWLDGNVYADVYRYAPDSFPVYDAPHAHSTAEVRSAQPTRDDPDTSTEARLAPRSTSATPAVPGNAPATRTPTGCCASTSPSQPTSPSMHPAIWLG